MDVPNPLGAIWKNTISPVKSKDKSSTQTNDELSPIKTQRRWRKPAGISIVSRTWKNTDRKNLQNRHWVTGAKALRRAKSYVQNLLLESVNRAKPLPLADHRTKTPEVLR